MGSHTTGIASVSRSVAKRRCSPREVAKTVLAHVGFEVKVFVDKIAFMYRIFSPKRFFSLVPEAADDALSARRAAGCSKQLCFLTSGNVMCDLSKSDQSVQIQRASM